MRTTLDIDDDVLAAAIELACGQKTTAGKVISGLARTALSAVAGASEPAFEETQKYRVSFRLMSRSGMVIGTDTVDKLPDGDA
jgi:hypothetical protein